jgi:hypothetical protein
MGQLEIMHGVVTWESEVFAKMRRVCLSALRMSLDRRSLTALTDTCQHQGF